MEKEEEEEEEKHTISNTPSSMDSSPPRSHRERKPLSLPPVGSPADSTVSSDRTSHGFFSPREDIDSVPLPETTPSIAPAKPSSPVGSPANSTVSSDRTSHGFFSPREDIDSVPLPETTPSIAPAKPPSPVGSPANSTVSSDGTSHGFFSPREDRDSVPLPETTPSIAPAKPPSPDTVVNRSVSNEPAVVMRVDPSAEEGFTGGVVVEEGGGGGRKTRPTLSILRKRRRESMVKRAALGFRVCGFVFCMISFSVMAADKNQGWSLDSFDRYKEFRYCISVNVISFVYSGVQACYLACHLTIGTYVPRNDLRHYFEFFVDQVLTYLLISASSSAASRVEDWESNWGKDKFPDMARASVAMSFLAFVALASSSLISGYTICSLKST